MKWDVLFVHSCRADFPIGARRSSVILAARALHGVAPEISSLILTSSVGDYLKLPGFRTAAKPCSAERKRFEN